MDSALSNLVEGTEDWLTDVLDTDRTCLLFTHVPIDLPETRDYILSVDANRSMTKYVLSGAPDLYRHHLQGRVSHTFTGHLHFTGLLRHNTTQFHLCNTGISMHDPNRDQNSVASAILLEQNGTGLDIQKVTVQ